MNDRHDPLETGEVVGTILQFSRQEEIPRKHIFEGRRRKRLTGVGQEILLQASCQIVCVRKEKVLGQVHYLIQSLIPQFGNLSIGET